MQAHETSPLVLFHAPQSRSSGVRVLLEEIGAPHTLHVLNTKTGEQRLDDYLAINPMGKVPALRHGETIITEQVAIYIYLADLFPAAGLAPAIGDPLRGPWLRWLVFHAASFEPAIVDRAQKREPGMAGMSPYGDFDIMLNTLRAQLAKGPFIVGERLSAADILWAGALAWITHFGLIPLTPDIADYITRITDRPSFTKVRADDARLLAGFPAA